MDLVVPLGLAVGGALITGLRVLWEYERGVVFRLGKLQRAKGPGLVFMWPFGLERMRKMDLRIVALDIAPAGHDHQGQRLGHGQRGGVLPRRRSR